MVDDELERIWKEAPRRLVQNVIATPPHECVYLRRMRTALCMAVQNRAAYLIVPTALIRLLVVIQVLTDVRAVLKRNLFCLKFLDRLDCHE
jgi:hypothetical protein